MAKAAFERDTPAVGKNAQRSWHEPSSRIQVPIIGKVKDMIHSPFLFGFGFGLILTPSQIFAPVQKTAIGA